LGREQAPPQNIEDYEVYVTVEEKDEMLIGGQVEKMHFFQIAP